MLLREGVQVEHTHLTAERVIETQRERRTNWPVLYIFADPLDVVLSLHQRDLDTGDNFFGANISWVRKHFENLELEPDAFEQWQAGLAFERDILQLERHFRSWHRPQPFAMLSLRYETEREPANLEALRGFLGLRKPPLPAKKDRIAGSMGPVPRRALRCRRAERRRSRHVRPAARSVRDAPDVCNWKPTSTGGTERPIAPERPAAARGRADKPGGVGSRAVEIGGPT